MRIGIVGSGLMGGKLGSLFARAGHDVIFSYSRSPRRLAKLAKDLGGHAQAGTPAEAVRDADTVLFAVHWDRVDDALAQTGNLAGKVLLTCLLPMDPGNTRLVVGHTSSGAEELAKKAPQAHVVSAFNTVPSEVLFQVFDARRKKSRPSVVYCADDRDAKGVAVELIRDVGFDPIDGGPLQNARYTEPMGLLVGHLAYEGGHGPELAYRFEWMRK